MASPATHTLTKPPLSDAAVRIRAKPRRSFACRCSSPLSMNGCEGSAVGAGVDVCETRVLPVVTSTSLAMPQLQSAVAALGTDTPAARSGIIRIEVPIAERAEAIGWLQAQNTMPRCFFSSREKNGELGEVVVNGGGGSRENLVSVAGVGSAVHFRGLVDPFAYRDWRCIRRFLSRSCPFIRAYGAIRFDPRSPISHEWSEFGSFYFFVPQVEFGEFEESSKIAINLAWDESLRWPWRKAIDDLRSTINQISPLSQSFEKRIPSTKVITSSHIPSRMSWEIAVDKALKMIRENSDFLKVVLARSSRIVTDSDIDPVKLLACLLVEGQDAYQFFIQPPNSPAFLGNTPEKLYHRKQLHISSEALAGTRARGRSIGEDLQIERDLLLSVKDDVEFTIVRESIRRMLESICKDVTIKPSKAIRKLPRVQHLSAQLTGRLRNEDDEFTILSSLHPSPAVCGLPAEEARQFISETEIFDRGMYAGPVGWLGATESEFAVGIRSALVEKGNGIYIYAGVGIVEGTDPSSEWEELELKASQFTKVLELVSFVQSPKLDPKQPVI